MKLFEKDFYDFLDLLNYMREKERKVHKHCGGRVRGSFCLEHMTYVDKKEIKVEDFSKNHNVSDKCWVCSKPLRSEGRSCGYLNCTPPNHYVKRFCKEHYKDCPECETTYCIHHYDKHECEPEIEEKEESSGLVAKIKAFFKRDKNPA